MDLNLARWQPLLYDLMWTAITVGVAYILGFVINSVVLRRLTPLARKTDSAWDDVVIEELKRRIPFWSLLIGLWLSLGYWPLSPRWLTLSSNVIKALGIGSVTLAIAAIATRLVAIYGPRAAPGAPVPGLLRNIARMVILTVGLLMILNSLGRDVTPALAALGVGGLAVALALQEPLSNLFAGVFIAVSGQVRMGDYVKLDSGAEGHISDLNWHSTNIQAQSGNVVIVPNAKFSQAIVTNFSRPTPEHGFSVDLAVVDGSDLARVERVTMEIAREVMRDVTGGLPEFEPSVRFAAITDLGVRFTVSLRARSIADQPLIRHELLRRVLARFGQEGIVLAHYAVPNVKTVVDR